MGDTKKVSGNVRFLTGANSGYGELAVTVHFTLRGRRVRGEIQITGWKKKLFWFDATGGKLPSNNTLITTGKEHVMAQVRAVVRGARIDRCVLR